MSRLNGYLASPWKSSVNAGGPGSGPRPGNGRQDDPGPSYAGVSAKGVKVSDKGQVKLTKPKNASDASSMLGAMSTICDMAVKDVANTVSLPANSIAKVTANLRLAHVASQNSKAINMCRPFVG